MGCTSGKVSQQKQKYQQMLEKLLTSYQSLELYIQNQRSTVFSYLAKNGESEVHLETQSDRTLLINICQDINLFRKYKKINKYKYEITIPKFFKQIKFCMYKMQLVLDMHNQFFQELELVKISPEGQKFIKKNQDLITSVQSYMSMITGYLQMNKELIDDDNKQTMCQLSEIKNTNQVTSASELDFTDLKVK